MLLLPVFVASIFSLVGASDVKSVPSTASIVGSGLSSDYGIWMTHRTFNDPDGDNYCRNLFKIYWTMDVANTCVQSNRANHTNEFVKMTIYDFQYEFQELESYYSDSACTNKTSSKYVYSGYWPNECYNQQEYQATTPLGYTNLGDYGYDFGIWIYNNASNCEAKGSSGANSVLYGNLNKCFNTSTTFQGDYMYTSCSAQEGISISHYASTDGTCAGEATASKLTPTNVCTTADYSVTSFTRGWANFACSKYL